MLRNVDLVSIVMPAYNCENYIVYSIESVLNQTYSNFELIIIDDGSKDTTLEIIRDYAKKDIRVKVLVNKKNLGVSETRNIGISLSNGNWIAFLDSDDIWIEDKLEKQMNYAKKFNSEFVFTGVSYIDEKGNPYSGIFEIPEKVSYKNLLRQNVITCSSVLVKNKYFDKIKMENDEMHEDYAVWLRILMTGVYAYGINEPLLVYRISPSSKSGKKIKTIRMTYKVFRFIGMNPVASFYFMCRHVIGSARKYRKIHIVKSNNME